MGCLSSLCIQVRDYRRRHHPKLEIECAPALVASSRAKFQVILSKNKNFTFLYVIFVKHSGTVQGSKLAVEQIFMPCMCIRAHNLCHDNCQLIIIAINRNHSASKINCN